LLLDLLLPPRLFHPLLLLLPLLLLVFRLLLHPLFRVLVLLQPPQQARNPLVLLLPLLLLSLSGCHLHHRCPLSDQCSHHYLAFLAALLHCLVRHSGRWYV
jgi:hypothetical protein